MHNVREMVVQLLFVCVMCVSLIECPAWVRVLVYVSVCMCVPSCALCPITCLHMYVHMYSYMPEQIAVLLRRSCGVCHRGLCTSAPDRTRGLHARNTTYV